MKRAAFLLIFTFVSAIGLIGAEDEEESASNTNPDAGGVVIDPSQGNIAPGDEITITFPNAMVPTDRIDVGDQTCPFTSEPKLEGTFLWKSQTEGVFTVRGVVPGAHHRLTLAPKLADASGKQVNAPDWSAELTAPQFAITTDFEQREHLSAQPQIFLDATYDVKLAEVAAHVYFQDRDSHARFPVEVIQSTDETITDPPVGKSFRVTPRESLPVAHTYDLVVNGLMDAKTRRPLQYLKVFPVGKTEPLKIDWVGAFNHPLDEPAIRIKFTDDIDPAEATSAKIRIEPAVAEMQLLASGDEVAVKGKFDLTKRYSVTVSPDLKGERGYGLTSEAHWFATFHPKEAAIIFPASQFFMRARQELRFSFFQINAPAVTWKLAQIPMEKLGQVTARVREFERNATDPVTGRVVTDPRTGFAKQYQTELLVDAFSLPVVDNGTFDATSGDASVRRDIHCAAPKSGNFSGAYLLEASSRLGDGRIIGNRSVICSSDFILTQKRLPASVVLRIAKMSDAKPVAGVTARAVTKENIELARAVTDEHGLATFDRDKILPAKTPGSHLFIADTAQGPALQFADGQSYSTPNDDLRLTRKPRAEIIADRNLYRPGQLVKMKGMMRINTASGLAIPAATEVHWRVIEGYGDRIVGEGPATLSPYGGWEAEWKIPDKIKLGNYEIRAQVGGENYDGTTSFRIEEYRVPIFSVVVEAKPEVGQTAHAHVSSAYFHGAPNVGARIHWKASWSAFAEYGNEEQSYKKRFNGYAELGPHLDADNEELKSIEGDAKLDEHGFADLACESPFKDNAAIGRADVFWRADVTSLDGQTITGGDTAKIFPVAARLGIKVSERSEKPRGVDVSIDAVDKDDAKVSGIAVHADLFHVTTKTVKEQLAPFVYRYRNSDQFAKIASKDAKTPADFNFPVTTTGRYVVAATIPNTQAPMVSDEATVSGEELAELPVQNETSFKIEHQTGPFAPGEKAALSIQAPLGGMAWVSIETDQILDTLLVPLSGNAGRIELPIKKEYAPNATVSIYLVRPGGEKSLPLERFATSEIQVSRPDRQLKIEPHLASASVKPGETVRGDVRVTSEGNAIADADLAVFAVDDAVLKLGEWQLPDILANFYPRNPFSVRNFQSLENYVEEIAERSLTQKGFIIGGGGEEAVPNVKNVRKEFRTLAFWQGSLKTDANGKAVFDFTAPDNLTTYRIVAVGETKANQFGADASATVKVSKPLLINAALPRFLRDGDEIELRATVQEDFADSEEIRTRCVTDVNCKLLVADRATEKTTRNAPTVFRFRAKVADRDLLPTKIHFEAVAKSNAKMSDAIEITLPVQPPTIVRKESVAGPFTGPQFDASKSMPENWKRGRGKFNATVSTSPWLPKIAGIPVILDYPHGCFEQISTKLLGYSFLANLVAYLPDIDARDAEYRAVLERGMKQFNDSLLAEGMLPYWPGGDTGNLFVTCQAFWAVNESVTAGFHAPEGLRDKLAGALRKIVSGQTSSNSFEKCFALFVLTQYEQSDDFKSSAHELYLRRNENGDEGRALLAIALHRLNIMPHEKEQLLREIDAPIKSRAFDPRTLSSTTRAEAICALAFDTIAPKIWTAEKKQRMRSRMLALMDSSAALSTQENLWLLLEFKSMIGAEKAEALNAAEPKGIPSKNGRSAAWIDHKIGDDLLVKGLNKGALNFLLRAEYSTEEVETDRVDRGFRVERVVRNLTDAKRTGANNAPFKLGDQILVTYRMNTRKLQNYVALEDSLPAGLETVNPNLAMIGKFFELPASAQGDRTLGLSYSEMRDRSTLLYFDTFEPGSGAYSVLARATAAGTFRWPATQVVPMYDSRFSGLSPSSLCVVSGE
jgi:alpha-2-macroglobulin